VATRTLLLPLFALAAVACGGESSAGPVAAACSSALATRIALNAGAYQLVDPTADAGCLDLAANRSADSAEYLLVAQSAGGAPGDSAPFALRSGGLAAVAASSAPALLGARAAPARSPRWVVRLRQRGSIPAGFDRRLRARGAVTSTRLRTAARRAVVRSARAASSPPPLGSVRTFSVCSNYDCSAFQSVTARVQSVGAHVAVYVDVAAPPNGFTASQVDSLRQLFDVLYATDTVSFGGISDIDTNGVVLALMTVVVNRLVTAAECASGGYVAGFFLPDDLDPTAANSNKGEIFYTVVADPNGTVSCVHTVDELDGVLPSTFLHELQHVIGFNQHVLVRGGPEEDLWLDEALSSFAEELGGRAFLPDSDTFSQYVIGDLYDAYQYLENPSRHFLLQESDTVLADFGAGWLYLRYLADQFGAGLTLKLEQTTLTGTDNIAAQTMLPFKTTVGRWALATWVTDLPGFAPSPELRYTSWSFRPIFASLSAQDPDDFPLAFPLVPARAAGAQVNLTGFLDAGSGAYVRALQGPGGGGLSILLNGNGGPIAPAIAPQVEIIRIR
jgi:hypothetical protein